MPNDRITLIEPYGNRTSNRTVPHGMTGEDAYERLRIHHPNSNARAEASQDPADMERNSRGNPRPGRVVEGAMEEISMVGDRNGIPLVKKDLIMETSGGSRNMMIPNPVEGYVQFTGDSANTINIWSAPPGDPDRELLGRVLHGATGTSPYRDGQLVPYGAPLVQQSNTGTPPIHAHIELEPAQFRRYLGDILNDRITRSEWPGRESGQQQPVPATAPSVSGSELAGVTDPMFQQAIDHLLRRGPSGGFDNRDQMQAAAALLAAEARQAGLSRIDVVSDGADGRRLIATQRNPNNVEDTLHAHIDKRLAATVSLEQSLVQLEAAQPAPAPHGLPPLLPDMPVQQGLRP